MRCPVVLLAFFIVVMFVQLSCGTRKTLTEQVFVHDTLKETRTDTLRVAALHARGDTVRESKTQVITLRQDSARTDTLKVETVYERWRTVYVTDTINIYRHLADSLQTMNDRLSVKKVTAPRHTMERWCVIVLLAMVSMGVYLMYALWRKKQE